MNKWKIVSIVLGISMLMFGFYYLNSDVGLKKSQEEKENISGFLSQYFQLNGRIMGTDIENMECGLVRENVLLSDMVKEKPILVYRYVASGCRPCIEKDLGLLTERFKQSDSTLVRVFGSYSSRRDYLIGYNNKTIELPIYNVPENSINLETEEYGISYCFILHPNMKVSNVFIPDQNNQEYTRQYFLAVKRFLNDL